MRPVDGAEHCPFCGVSKTWLEAIAIDNTPYFYVCCPCGAEGPTVKTQAEAVARWNARK